MGNSLTVSNSLKAAGRKGARKRSAIPVFVVHRHFAHQLHYDFRLEMDGVLKSWALPKGPSMNPADKRLALPVKDHPLAYKDFEGCISEGYGKGMVEIWDKGHYQLSGPADTDGLKALKDGHLHLVLKGKKLKGEFFLIRTGKGKKASWLLIKKNDRYAQQGYDSEDMVDADSAVSKELEKRKVRKRKDTNASHVLPFGAVDVTVSHWDKLLWPDEGITKGMLIEYYQSIAPLLIPFLKNRPQSLLRHPNGIGGKGFFHKDAGQEAPSWVKTYPVYTPSAEKIVHYLLCNNKATLAYLNNLGCIELNPWHSVMTAPDHPDYMIFDLDPSDQNTFAQAVEVAHAFRELFETSGARCFVKTSGGRGLHIYIPMARKYAYPEVRGFAKEVCEIILERMPGLVTMQRHPAERGGKIYLDYLQNAKGQTIASVYAVRPKSGAPVSMPVLWKDLKPDIHPHDFNIRNALQWAKKANHYFMGVFGEGISIEQVRKRMANTNL